MKKNLFVSVSGGETSWYMAQLIKNEFADKYNLVFGFANTGKERQETIDFNLKCSEYFDIKLHWVEAVVHHNEKKACTHKLVDLASYSKNGEPFTEVIKKYGIPNVAFPHCTRELKSKPLRSFAKEYFNGEPFKIAIGIRADEIDRLSTTSNYVYPLVNRNVVKADINRFWADLHFRLELKSYEGNCDLCFKKSLRKLLTIIAENKPAVKWWKETEKAFEQFGAGRSKAKAPFRFNRNNISIDDLITMSLSHFEKSVDEKNYFGEPYKQLKLFDIPLDISNGCIESCEPF